MKLHSQLLFVLAFLVVFVVFLTIERARAETVTELIKEKSSGIIVAYVIEGKVIPVPGNESYYSGYIPRNLIREQVKLDTESETFKQEVTEKIYEL